MKNLIDSINITLEVLQNYNDFLSANKKNNESEKIFKQEHFNSKKHSAKNNVINKHFGLLYALA
jgi:hypothetical protein